VASEILEEYIRVRVAAGAIIDFEPGCPQYGIDGKACRGIFRESVLGLIKEKRKAKTTFLESITTI